MATEIGEDTVRHGNSAEIAIDNVKLAETSGSFRRACKVLGGTPVPLVQPVLTLAMDCLSGMLPMTHLGTANIFMLFFVALFLDSEVLANYIVFDLIERNNCVDILALISKLRKRDQFLSMAVINYFIMELHLDPDYVYDTLSKNPRKLRWEISKTKGVDRSNSLLCSFPSTCCICKLVINDPDHLSLTKKCVRTLCCQNRIHIRCLKKLMALVRGRCPYCRCLSLSGVNQPSTDTIVSVPIGIVCPVSSHNAHNFMREESVRVLNSPYERREHQGPIRMNNSI